MISYGLKKTRSVEFEERKTTIGLKPWVKASLLQFVWNEISSNPLTPFELFLSPLTK